MLAVEDVRKDIPLLTKCIYMHSASSSPVPLPVIRAVSDYYQNSPLNYGEKASSLGREVTKLGDDVRNFIARFIGAESPSQIVLTKNTTEAINIVAGGLDWGPGDEVILSALEHQSNIMPWMRMTKDQGGRLRVIQPDSAGVVDPEDVRNNISPKTKIICLTHVSNALGTIQPVEEVGKIAQEHDLLYLVDAAQSEGRMPVDMGRIGCDFLVSCGRKALMGPQGTGLLCGRQEALDGLKPMIVGSKAGNVTTPSSFQLLAVPHRLEPGVLNTAGLIGLGRAVHYIQEIGTQQIMARLRKLTQLLRSGLENLPDVELYGTGKPEGQTGIVSWNLKGRDCDELAATLDEVAGIVVGAGAFGSPLAMQYLGVQGVVRTSLHFYNTEEEINKVLEVVSRTSE